jgi:hypothetical protein
MFTVKLILIQIKNKRIVANEKILRIKLNKIRKLKGVKNALYLFNNIHKY